MSSKLTFEIGKTRFGVPTVEVREKQRGGFNPKNIFNQQIALSPPQHLNARSLLTIDPEILDRAMKELIVQFDPRRYRK